jgi:ParB/RepB/Spo0J family partition protein
MMVADKPTSSVQHLAAQLVAHVQIVPSATNPRKKFDDAKLRELAESMKPPVGILEPLVVRHLSVERAKALGLNPPDQFFEIIAGERRWRAAAIAGLTEIPIVVRDVDDEQVLRLQLIENKNREDVHPLDEAEAMERLLKLNRTESPKTIAAAIGMSERYVQNRLHYLRLVPEVKEAFRKEEITAGHVDLLMRLPADDQKRAFAKGCFEEFLDYEDGSDRTGTKRVELVSVRDLQHWIKHNVQLRVAAKAPEMDFLPEVAEAVAAASVDDAPKLVELADSYHVYGDKGKPQPLTRSAWQPVKKGEKCDHQTRGVVVLGDKRGQILTVCTGVGKCKLHFPHSIRADNTKPPAGFKGDDINGAAASAARKAKADHDARQRREREKGERDAKVLSAAMKQARTVPAGGFKPTPGIIELLVEGLHATSLRDAVLHVLDFDTFTGTPTALAKAVRRFKLIGVDLLAIEKELFPPTSAKKPALPKKAKPARESLSKKASAGTRKALAPRKRKAGKKR